MEILTAKQANELTLTKEPELTAKENETQEQYFLEIMKSIRKHALKGKRKAHIDSTEDGVLLLQSRKLYKCTRERFINLGYKFCFQSNSVFDIYTENNDAGNFISW